MRSTCFVALLSRPTSHRIAATLLFGSVPSIYLCLYRDDGGDDDDAVAAAADTPTERNQRPMPDRIAANDTLIPNMQCCGGGCGGGGGQ